MPLRHGGSARCSYDTGSGTTDSSNTGDDRATSAAYRASWPADAFHQISAFRRQCKGALGTNVQGRAQIWFVAILVDDEKSVPTYRCSSGVAEEEVSGGDVEKHCCCPTPHLTACIRCGDLHGFMPAGGDYRHRLLRQVLSGHRDDDAGS